MFNVTSSLYPVVSATFPHITEAIIKLSILVM